MTKSDIRAEIRAKKRAMPPAQIEDCSRRLAQMLFAHPAYQNARSIYSYLPFNQEIRTLPILEQAQRDGKRVAIPKVLGNIMEFFWLDDLNAVEPGYCGIPEPCCSLPVADDDRALVLTPGLAFDHAGHRCGYGGGFYDRWLEQHPGHPKLALCYDFQLLPRLDAEPHDVPVDYILSVPLPQPKQF